jgi:hypothetical protein
VVVVVVMKMIFDEDILALLNVALYPFFCLPEEEIWGIPGIPQWN